MTVFAGTAPVGALLAGLTAATFGTPTSVALGGGVTALAAIGLGVGSRRSVLGGRRPVPQLGSLPDSARPSPAPASTPAPARVVMYRRSSASPGPPSFRLPTADVRPSTVGDD